MQIYTMPQAFMDDPNVALKWKLYGLINGFWVNGLTVYAANAFFAEKLGCDERSVRRALEELEELNLLVREISGHSRIIKPSGAIHTDFSQQDSQSPLRGRSESAKQDSQSPPNASSNAISINPAFAAFSEREEYTVTPIDEYGELVPSKTKQPPKSKNAFYEKGVKWAEGHTGRRFVNRVKQYAALKKAAANGITEIELTRRWKELESQEFYREKGIDWHTVVNSFDKRR